jgi:hypothetical protein
MDDKDMADARKALRDAEISVKRAMSDLNGMLSLRGDDPFSEVQKEIEDIRRGARQTIAQARQTIAQIDHPLMDNGQVRRTIRLRAPENWERTVSIKSTVDEAQADRDFMNTPSIRREPKDIHVPHSLVVLNRFLKAGKFIGWIAWIILMVFLVNKLIDQQKAESAPAAVESQWDGNNSFGAPGAAGTAGSGGETGWEDNW